MIDLQEYIEASRTRYEALIAETVTHPGHPQVNAELHFKHVRFDGNGIPMFVELAKCLADHVITYCLSARRRGTPIAPDEWSKLDREARNLLRRSSASGEAGDMLLYLLLEAGLGAPQMITKVELKTNPRLEVNGSDGIHMRIDPSDGSLVVYFCESKLYANVSNAMRSLRTSLESFHRDRLVDHEIGLVTSHFKHADAHLREQVLRYLDPDDPLSIYRIEHACLVGFSWPEYETLARISSRQEVIRRFVSEYDHAIPSLAETFRETFNGVLPKYHQEVFFLPFDCVQRFRDAFLREVT